MTLASHPRQEESRDKMAPVVATGSGPSVVSWPLSAPSGQDVSCSEEEIPPESPFVAGRETSSRVCEWALI